MDGIIKFERIVGRYIPGESARAYLKYELRLCFEKIVKDKVFDDLTETAVRDVLIKMLMDWNYYNKK